jgi:hypothetical protein
VVFDPQMCIVSAHSELIVCCAYLMMYCKSYAKYDEELLYRVILNSRYLPRQDTLFIGMNLRCCTIVQLLGIQSCQTFSGASQGPSCSVAWDITGSSEYLPGRTAQRHDLGNRTRRKCRAVLRFHIVIDGCCLSRNQLCQHGCFTWTTCSTIDSVQGKLYARAMDLPPPSVAILWRDTDIAFMIDWMCAIAWRNHHDTILAPMSCCQSIFIGSSATK